MTPRLNSLCFTRKLSNSHKIQIELTISVALSFLVRQQRIQTRARRGPRRMPSILWAGQKLSKTDLQALRFVLAGFEVCPGFPNFNEYPALAVNDMRRLAKPSPTLRPPAPGHPLAPRRRRPESASQQDLLKSAQAFGLSSLPQPSSRPCTSLPH